MPVYIDDMEAPFRGMKMCHMIADTREELLEMVKKIGVNPKWMQKADTPHEHFDISLGKKVLAIQYGAIPISMMQLGEKINEKRNAQTLREEGL